jgi:4-hydroxythreonine-4-phosphate dehydrogenase
MKRKPRIGVIPGEPAGIGPELIAKLLNEPETRQRADVLLVGDHSVFALGMRQAELDFHCEPVVDPSSSDWTQSASHPWFAMETIAEDEIELANVSTAGGRSSLRTLDRVLDFAVEGIVDAVLFAPFNKASLHLAGLGFDDELHYMGARLNVDGYISELNTVDGMWTSRVTSHIPLKDVAATLSVERIVEAIVLADATLKRSGYQQPRIAVAALNPHAGDNGNFGREEIDIIAPAVRQAADQNMKVDGPWPSDTVFLKAKSREVDAVVTMYHDQGQIALKLMGFDRGVTVQGGLPVPVSTPAHGTAFDIAGQGVADLGATRAAFDIACKMATEWQKQ